MNYPIDIICSDFIESLKRILTVHFRYCAILCILDTVLYCRKKQMVSCLGMNYSKGIILFCKKEIFDNTVLLRCCALLSEEIEMNFVGMNYPQNIICSGFIESQKKNHTVHFRHCAILCILAHSRPMRNQMKLKETLMGPAQGEQVCHKDSKYILFEILANRTWKGCTSSCQPILPDSEIRLAQPEGASTALPCPICQDFKQNTF